MSLVLACGLVLAGLVVLALGGEILVRGATSLARLAGMAPAIIGLTVVALGTSLPELVVSVMAAARGEPDLAVGNVVGSNLANLTLIVGITAVITPLPILGQVVRREWPFLFVITAGCLVCARDGLISRGEAWAGLITLVLFIGWAVHLARVEATRREVANLHAEVAQRDLPRGLRAMGAALLAIVVGIGLLIGGGQLLVDGAIGIAERAGMTPRVIGLTIVAVGTSAPEVATSIVAALRKHTDVAVANLIGSNVFNTLGILGAAGAVTPLPVAPEIARGDLWWMLAATAFLFPLMRIGMRVSRLDGFVLLVTYALYITWAMGAWGALGLPG